MDETETHWRVARGQRLLGAVLWSMHVWLFTTAARLTGRLRAHRKRGLMKRRCMGVRGGGAGGCATVRVRV